MPSSPHSGTQGLGWIMDYDLPSFDFPNVSDCFQHFSALRSLCLTGIYATDQNVIQVANHCRQLEELNIEDYMSILSDESVKHFLYMGQSQLRKFSTEGCRLSDATLGHLDQCLQLETLDVFGTSIGESVEFGRSGLRAVGCLTNLQQLCLGQIESDVIFSSSKFWSLAPDPCSSFLLQLFDLTPCSCVMFWIVLTMDHVW